jgi:ribosome-associated translation inhibitor RaiA
MRLHIEGKHAGLAPHLMGWIAERLVELNTPDEDIVEASITFLRQKRQEVARVHIQVAGKLLQVTQRGATPDAAIDAALQMIQRALQEVRATRRVRAAMPVTPGEALRTYAASAARQA